MSPDFKAMLAQMTDAFLGGKLTFEAFQEAYSRTFIDEMPDDALSATELEQYGEVHEKAEWTARAPSKEDRDHGWMDVAEFTNWLRAHRAKLRG